jgi:homoserine trans-succinylase
MRKKIIIGILMNDQDQWQRMKDKFLEVHVRYYKLKEKFIDQLNAAGLRISRRSKTMKQFTKNDAIQVDEYEYDKLDLEDEYERMDDSLGICDQIDWNVTNNDSTVYMLTTSLIPNKTICLLSNVKPDIRYRHVCEYGL